jgi:hypothetical protein
MVGVKEFGWFADKTKWEAARAKVPASSPLSDPGIAGGCDKIGAMWKAIRWDHIGGVEALAAKAKPEQLQNEQFWRGVRAAVEAEYKKVGMLGTELGAQAKRGKQLLEHYGNKPTAYMPVLKYAQQLIADDQKFAGAAEASLKADLAAIDRHFAAAADAKAKQAQQDMKADEGRIRDAATARLAAAGAVAALDKTAHAVTDTLANAAKAAAAKKPAAVFVQLGKKQIEGAVGEMKKASVARSELETAIKLLAGEPFAPAMAAAGKEELTRSQKVAADMKARQEAAEKALGEARKRLEALAKVK